MAHSLRLKHRSPFPFVGIVDTHIVQLGGQFSAFEDLFTDMLAKVHTHWLKVLDLIAARAGVGLALRCLSFLELDVQNNWKPFKPVLQFIRYNV